MKTRRPEAAVAEVPRGLRDQEYWDGMRKTLQERQGRIAQLLDDYQKRDPRLTREAVVDLGEFIFNALAIEEADEARWSTARQIQLKRDNQELEIKKLRFDMRKYKDQCARLREAVQEDDLTFEEKEAAMKKILGIRA